MAQAQMTRPTGNGAAKAGMPVEKVPYVERGEGWLVFVGVVFLLVAVLNLMWGIAALASDSHFLVDELLFFNLTAWGWIAIGVAVAEALTGLLVLNRSPYGTMLGIVMASLGLIAVLLAIGVYPLWSVTMMVMCGLILYGLTVYGVRKE